MNDYYYEIEKVLVETFDGILGEILLKIVALSPIAIIILLILILIELKRIRKNND